RPTPTSTLFPYTTLFRSGKGLSTDEFVLYHLAKTTGRPVRAVTRYADELTTANPRHASRIRLRTGVDAGGRIVAHESHALFDGRSEEHTSELQSRFDLVC